MSAQLREASTALDRLELSRQDSNRKNRVTGPILEELREGEVYNPFSFIFLKLH